MKKCTAMVLFVSLVVACGDSDSDGNNNTTSNNATSNNATSNNATSNNATSNNATSNNATSNNATSNNATSNNATSNNATSNNATSNNGVLEGPCDPPPSFDGQLRNKTTETDYTMDANLSSVANGVSPQSDDEETMGVNEGIAIFDPPIEVRGAIVTANRGGPFARQRFYVQDSQVGIEVFLNEDAGTFTIGDTVSFDVRATENIDGEGRVTSIRNFRVESSDNLVYAPQAAGTTFESSDLHKIVRLNGQLSSLTSCGDGQQCFDFKHGSQTMTVRTNSNASLSEDECLAYVGPLFALPGPYTQGVTPSYELETFSLEWITTYEPIP